MRDWTWQLDGHGDQRLPRVLRGAVGQVGRRRRDPRPAERRVGRVGVFRPVVRTANADEDHVSTCSSRGWNRPVTAWAPLTAHEAAGVFYDDVHHGPRRRHVDDRRPAPRGGQPVRRGSGRRLRLHRHRVADGVLLQRARGRKPQQPDGPRCPAGRRRPSRSGRRRHRRRRRPSPPRVRARWRHREPCYQRTRSGDCGALQGVCGGVPAYAIPTDPVLDSPTVRELLSAARGTLVHGDDALLDRESSGLLVAAMTMPNVLDRLFEGCVVISPADRADVLLGLLLAYLAKTFVAGRARTMTAFSIERLISVSRCTSRSSRRPRARCARRRTCGGMPPCSVWPRWSRPPCGSSRSTSTAGPARPARRQPDRRRDPADVRASAGGPGAYGEPAHRPARG